MVAVDVIKAVHAARNSLRILPPELPAACMEPPPVDRWEGSGFRRHG